MPHTAAEGIATPDITADANPATRILPARIATSILCTQRLRTEGTAYATSLVNAGMSLPALMAPLGHVTTEMTMRYASLAAPAVRTAYDEAMGKARARPTMAIAPACSPSSPTGSDG